MPHGDITLQLLPAPRIWDGLVTDVGPQNVEAVPVPALCLSLQGPYMLSFVLLERCPAAV